MARYIHVALKNLDAIDIAKSAIFNENFDLHEMFGFMDYKKRGYVDENDLKKLIKDNGADIKAIKIERIIKYFASVGSRFTKAEFLKGIALPSWKIVLKNQYLNQSEKQNQTENQNPVSGKKISMTTLPLQAEVPSVEVLKKRLFKLIIDIYLALEQDDTEKLKIKNVDLQVVFDHVSHDKEFLKIDELSFFLIENKFTEPDCFNLLRFMGKKFEINFDEFKRMMAKHLCDRFEVNESSPVIRNENKGERKSILKLRSTSRIYDAEERKEKRESRLKKKESGRTEVTDDIFPNNIPNTMPSD